MKYLQYFVVYMIGVILLFLTQGCRSQEDLVDYQRQNQRPDSDRVPRPDFDDQTVPDTERTPPPRFPDTLPTGKIPVYFANYATEITLFGGCEETPKKMAVAKEHQSLTPCESLLATAWRTENGIRREVPANFIWTVEDSKIAEIVCEDSPRRSLCRPIGKTDVIDTWGGFEPETEVFACVLNACPALRPADCEDIVCTSVSVVSVVNLEGEWLMAAPIFDEKTLLRISQDGRSFKDKALNVEDGGIDGQAIEFELGDYAFDGILDPDRRLLSGDIYEMMTLDSIGPWWAKLQAP